MVIHLRLGWNGWKHPGAGGVSTRVVEVCESIGCALALQSMRSAKAEAANLDSNSLCGIWDDSLFPKGRLSCLNLKKS